MAERLFRNQDVGRPIRPSSTTLVRIVAPHFVAGLEHDNDSVRRAAPIIKYMIGWEPRKVWDYCKSKGWKYKTLV